MISLPLPTRLALALFTLSLAAFAITVPARADQPETMKAVRIRDYGPASQLAYENAPKPKPARGELLVRVKAAGVNPVDWKIRNGLFKGSTAMNMPLTLGYDIAGVVESVGPDVTKFKPGDEVFAYLSLRRGGGYAQYAIALESEAAIKPAKLDFIHAAAVPLAALTAWQALFDKANLQQGQTVLIHAGAGGVGHFAVQLAKWKGARVLATASAANHEFVKSLGADEVIDYRSVRFEDVAHDVDVVLDAVGGDTTDRSAKVLKKGGILISIAGSPTAATFADRSLRVGILLVQPSGPQLAELARLIDAGALKPHVNETFPLDEAAKAHGKSESGRTRGKLVLTVE